jgi:hypothetical protein
MEIKTVSSFKLNEREIKDAIRNYCVDKLREFENIELENVDILGYDNDVKATVNDFVAIVTVVKTNVI